MNRHIKPSEVTVPDFWLVVSLSMTKEAERYNSKAAAQDAIERGDEGDRVLYVFPEERRCEDVTREFAERWAAEADDEESCPSPYYAFVGKEMEDRIQAREDARDWACENWGVGL